MITFKTKAYECPRCGREIQINWFQYAFHKCIKRKCSWCSKTFRMVRSALICLGCNCPETKVLTKDSLVD